MVGIWCMVGVWWWVYGLVYGGCCMVVGIRNYGGGCMTVDVLWLVYSGVCIWFWWMHDGGSLLVAVW